MVVMTDNPMQSLVVRLPSDRARRITRIVDAPGSGYESVDEFIRVAVENQLTMEIGNTPPLESKPSRSKDERPARETRSDWASDKNMSTLLRSSESAVLKVTPSEPVSTDALLRLPETEGIKLERAAVTQGVAFSSFTNRLAPILAGPRVLANLSSEAGAPTIDVFLDLSAKAARSLGLRLRSEDDAAGRRGRFRRSTAWPVGDDESKSLIRYRNSFMFTTEKMGGFSGPLLELGLAVVVNGQVYLTQDGALAATEPIPAVDVNAGIELFTGRQRELMSEAVVRIPGERSEIGRFIKALHDTGGVQDDIDKELAKCHRSWTDAQVVSHRAAMLGRLRDLEVIDVQPGPKTMIVEGSNFQFFDNLLSTTQGTEGRKEQSNE